jgi:hypothetical protein
MPPIARRAAALLAVLALAAGLAAGPAAAHGPDGVMTITEATQTGDTTITIEVGIVYANDDDPAEDATVEAVLTGEDGTVIGPTSFQNIRSALYGAEVSVPSTGTWQVAVTSTDPESTATATVVVADAGPTTTTTTTTTTTAPAAGDTGAATGDDAAAPAAADTDGGVSPVFVAAIVLAVLVVVAAALVPVVSRRRRND